MVTVSDAGLRNITAHESRNSAAPTDSRLPRALSSSEEIASAWQPSRRQADGGRVGQQRYARAAKFVSTAWHMARYRQCDVFLL